jgi:glycosyltransferase involved in cell wall biosynthesis
MPPPRLSVGIPAYNRPESLERAVRSVLAQDMPDLEVVVSDDASPDPRVAALGERLAAEDARVRFSRRERNLGHAGNYRWVLEHARAEHFMWLSDDDWLDPGYAARCLGELERDGSVLVAGQAQYGDVRERPIELVQRRPGVRLLRYFQRVNMNGPLFGVARRENLVAADFEEVVGGDWLVVARLARRGRVRTLTDVHVHRSAEGLGSHERKLAASFGLAGFFARHHHLVVAGNVWREIAATRSLPPVARVVTATLCAGAIVARYNGVHVMRALGLGALERRAIELVRKREEALT